MQENTNKAIAYNTIILYVRLAVTSICALFTTRFALQALGVTDFGLFSVLGSIISFIGIINTIMVATSYRYIATAIGKGDVNEMNIVFNVNLNIHIAIAFITLLFAFIIGEWYIHHYINYEGDIRNALMVFRFSMIASILTFIGVPYNGLLVAKEKFIIFCGTDILSQIMKLGIAFSLLFYFEHKLFVYTLSISIFTVYPTLVYLFYCNKHYNDITKFRVVRDKQRYKEIFGFSAWVAYGAVASVGKAQGASLLINSFFNTAMNTALGIANSISSLITMFVQNVAQPIAPQITKNYAAGNKERCDQLLIMSTKFSFLTILLISSPFFVDMEWILILWLGKVPPYAAMFAKLLIIDALVGSFNSGLSSIIFASGKIGLYQVVINTIRLFSIFVAYLVLKAGGPPYSLLYAYIIFTFIIVLASQWVLYKTLNYDILILIKGAYLPSLFVLVLFVPILFIHPNIYPLIYMAITFAYLCILVFFVGFSKGERNYIYNIFISQLKW